MLHPDSDLVRGISRVLNGRLSVAFDHIVCDVLGQPRPDRWSSAPAAHALQALFREAAVAGDIPRLRALLDGNRPVLSLPDPSGTLKIIGWHDPIRPTAEFDLLQSAFRDDIGLTEHLVAPAPDSVAALRRRITQLLDRLRIALPLWEEEFRALVSEIYLAETPQGGFAGASAFAAWGAILVNPKAQRDDLTLLLTLIHESSHLKLFSAYLEDEIVLNDPEETYSSPLRVQPRPMNGIYHAAFVLARMVCFLNDLQASGRATDVLGEGARVEPVLEDSIAAFDAAFDVIRLHGLLTALGQTIIAEAATGVRAQRAVA